MIGIYLYKAKKSYWWYVGQSLNIEQRHQNHLHTKKPSRFEKILQSTPEEDYDFIILEECSKEELNDKEIYWFWRCEEKYDMVCSLNRIEYLGRGKKYN